MMKGDHAWFLNLMSRKATSDAKVEIQCNAALNDKNRTTVSVRVPVRELKTCKDSLTTLLNLADSIRIKTACNMSFFFVKVPSLPDPSSKGKAYSFCDAKVSKIEPGQRLSTVLGHESGWNGLPEWSVSQASRQCIFEPRDLQ